MSRLPILRAPVLYVSVLILAIMSFLAVAIIHPLPIKATDANANPCVLNTPPWESGGFYNRCYAYGWFKNTYQGGANATALIPGLSSAGLTVDTFISTVKSAASAGTPGGVMVVKSMLGIFPSKGVAFGQSVTASQLTSWEALVRCYNSKGQVQWHQSLYLGVNTNNSRYNAVDDLNFFHTTTAETTYVINFGSGQFIIKKSCGNPVGELGYLSCTPTAWNYTPYVSGVPAANSTVSRGATIAVTAYANNSGNEAGAIHNMRVVVTDPNSAVTYSSSSPVATQVSTTTWQWGSVPGIPAGANSPLRTISFTVSSTAPNGAQICFSSGVDNFTGSLGVVTSTGIRYVPSGICYTVSVPATYWQYDAQTLPTLAIPTPNTVVSVGTLISVVGRVQNSREGSGPTYSLTIAPTNASFVSGSAQTWPSAALAGYTAGPQQAASFTINNNAAGQTVCFNTSVTPVSGQSTPTLTITNNGPASGAQICYNVSVPIQLEKPYLEIRGASVWAGGVFADGDPDADPFTCTTAPSAKAKIKSVSPTTALRGSYAAYGVTASGAITDFGSIGPSYDALHGRSLTFANVSTLGEFYGPSGGGLCITNFYNLLTGASGTGFTKFGPITGPYALPAKSAVKQITLVSGDVTIGSDRTYGVYSASNPAQIPFEMVVATGNINITSGVQILDGLYIAGGTINTCSNIADPLSTTSGCDTQLVINGAFIANKIDFRRTAGGLTRNTGIAAETFIFSPEMYLGAPEVISSNLRNLQVKQFKDLPPVY